MLVEVETRIKTIQPLYADHRDGDHGLTAQEIARQSDIPLVNAEAVLAIWQRWGMSASLATVIATGFRTAGKRFAYKIK